MDLELGRPVRRLWALLAEGTFLNHGSYGACPFAVLDAQTRIRQEMEMQPDVFFQRRVEPAQDSALRRAAGEVAEFIGATANDVALVENATTGIQAVLRSMSFAPGDEILITDHQYNAVRLAVEQRCRETGAVPSVARIPVPTSPGDVLARILDAAGRRVKLAIVDHITSPTALVFPIESLVAGLHSRGIPVLGEGAHVLGHRPLDVRALGAEWYVSNAHKWLYAPKGTAILYASEKAKPITQPVVASHFVAMGFPRAFDYIGTRDYSSWLSLPAALAFFRDLGLQRVWDHTAELVKTGSELLMNLGARPVGPLEMCGAMRTFILPQRRPAAEQDPVQLRRDLWERDRIQIRTDALLGHLTVRFSAQAYVGQADLVKLAATLERSGWPGR